MIMIRIKVSVRRGASIQISEMGLCYMDGSFKIGPVLCLWWCGRFTQGSPPGLSALIGNPQQDVLYLFSNRRRNLLKFLSVDKYGIWVGTRRLHHQSFYWPEDPRVRQKLTAKELACLLVGGDLKKMRLKQLCSGQ